MDGPQQHRDLQLKVSFSGLIEILALTIAEIHSPQWKIYNSWVLLFDKDILRETFEVQDYILRKLLALEPSKLPR